MLNSMLAGWFTASICVHSKQETIQTRFTRLIALIPLLSFSLFSFFAAKNGFPNVFPIHGVFASGKTLFSLSLFFSCMHNAHALHIVHISSVFFASVSMFRSFFLFNSSALFSCGALLMGPLPPWKQIYYCTKIGNLKRGMGERMWTAHAKVTEQKIAHYKFAICRLAKIMNLMKIP